MNRSRSTAPEEGSSQPSTVAPERAHRDAPARAISGEPKSDATPTFADIFAAGDRLAGAIEHTPCLESRTLSRMCGCALFLKFENLQFTASFKERGALNKLLSMSAADRAAGVCAMSAGNHAQGVAYHASQLGVPATIVMPEGTPLTKIARTREHGARVIVEGSNLSEALTIAKEIAGKERLTFVHPYDDPLVIAGQGTMAVEIFARANDRG